MLNGQTMIIACPACTTRYVVPDSAIGIEGRTVRCAKCRHSWFQEGAAPQPVAAPVPPPAPSPAPAPSPPAPEPDAIAAPAPTQRDDFGRLPEDRTPETAATTAPAPPPPAAQAPDPGPPPEPVEAYPPPAVDEPAPGFDPPAVADEPPVPAAVYDDTAGWQPDDGSQSSFAHEPPFRPRVNRLKLWTWAAALFAIVALAGTAAVAMYGLPDWMPLSRQTFAEAQPDLVLDFPPNRQDRRTLPNGKEFFGASGTVTNVGKSRRTVPTILIVLRDARERIVYSWEVVPAKRQLAPGESVSINEAVTDVPKAAKIAEIGWKPG